MLGCWFLYFSNGQRHPAYKVIDYDTLANSYLTIILSVVIGGKKNRFRYLIIDETEAFLLFFGGS